MTIAEIIRKYRGNRFFRSYFEIKRKQRFLKNIITTNLFDRMRLSDKLTTLTTLVQLSKRDFGVTPRELDKKLLELSQDLKHQELDLLREFHADHGTTQ